MRLKHIEEVTVIEASSLDLIDVSSSTPTLWLEVLQMIQNPGNQAELDSGRAKE